MGHPVYSETFLDHFQNPRNVGELPAPAITVEVSNPVCGDILRLSARFQDGVVTAVAYKARGCTASIAAGSAGTGWIRGEAARGLGAGRAADGGEAGGGRIAGGEHGAGFGVGA